MDTAQTPVPVDTDRLIPQVRPALVRFFQRRCKNLSRAEDLAQEVIVRTLSRAELTSPEQARGYIFRAAANLWRDQHRRATRFISPEVGWDEESALNVTEGVPLERALVSEEELYRVNAVLLELSERTRDVFVLHRLEQMKYAEIARVLGVSVSAIEKHMSKALAHLSERMDDHETF
jgi:RNA polymerase sigma factor (sigma-70 family)